MSGTTDVLAGWLDRAQSSSRRARQTAGRERPVAGLRFAFYGRVSTVRFQDVRSSRGWQRQVAGDLIVGRGSIEAEFFDPGCSRRRSWAERPRAGALLAAIAGPARRFDAIVVGEYERAFAGDQLIRLLPMLDRYGVQLWLPEAGGPVNMADPAHQALVRCWVRSRSVRCCGRGGGCWRRWRSRCGSRAGIWVAGRPTGIGWWMSGRIRTVNLMRNGGFLHSSSVSRYTQLLSLVTPNRRDDRFW
jgi:hypothetical protein